jgi:TRAP transporter TAXI family solute receptor
MSRYSRVVRLLAAALLLCATTAANADERNAVIIGTGAPGGVYHPLGGAICRLVNLETDRHGLRCAAEISAGSIANMDALRDRRIDVAIVQSDVLADAFLGRDAFASHGPWSDLRTILTAHDEPFTLIVRPESGIRAAQDLRGRRVNIGNPGSGHRMHMDRIMGLLELKAADFAEVRELDPVQQVDALCAREVDAIVYTVGHPNGLVQSATAECGGLFVPVTEERVRPLLAAHPEYAMMLIPGGLYKGNDADTPTLGSRAAVVARADLADAIAAELARAVLEDFETFRKLHPAFAHLDRETMSRGAASVPLHSGVARHLDGSRRPR